MYPIKYFLLRKLITPLSHSKHEADYVALGTAIGLGVAFTPSVGIQMPLVLGIWIIVKKLKPAWDFNLLVALAWTWVTNIFTLAPIYYIFLVTGRLLLGRWENLRSFDTFQHKLTSSLDVEAGLFDSLWIYMVNLIDQFGLPLWIGSLPWAILFSWLGYHWSLSFIKHIRLKRELRHAKTTNGTSKIK